MIIEAQTIEKKLHVSFVLTGCCIREEKLSWRTLFFSQLLYYFMTLLLRCLTLINNTQSEDRQILLSHIPYSSYWIVIDRVQSWMITQTMKKSKQRKFNLGREVPNWPWRMSFFEFWPNGIGSSGCCWTDFVFPFNNTTKYKRLGNDRIWTGRREGERGWEQFLNTVFGFGVNVLLSESGLESITFRRYFSLSVLQTELPLIHVIG